LPSSSFVSYSHFGVAYSPLLEALHSA